MHDPALRVPLANEEATLEAGAALAGLLEGGAIVAIDGELGAGKSVFVRGMAAALGADPRSVSSPTFVLAQRYRGRSLDLVHVDAYRLARPDELDATGWDEWAGAPGVVTAVEWASRVGARIPPSAISIELRHVGGGAASERRELRVRVPEGELGDRLRDAFAAFTAVVEAPSRCRICGRSMPPGGGGPFCSERCRMVDLGRWFGGGYRLSRPVEADEPEE